MIKVEIMSKISLILFILISNFCHGQNYKVTSFKYVGGCDTHVMYRIRLSDSTFIDSTIVITANNHKFITVDSLKIDSDSWYYLNNGKWVLFFSKEKFNKMEETYWWGEGYGTNPSPPFTTATPLRIDNSNGKNIYVYKIRAMNENDITEYYFDFDIGIVKIVDYGERNKECRTEELIKISKD